MVKERVNRPLGPWVNLTFAATLLAVLVLGVSSYRNTSRLVEISQRVTESHELLLTVEGLLATLADAETGQRGYVITGDEQYLEPYLEAMQGLDGAMTRLLEQFSDSPDQLRRHAALRELINAKVKVIQSTIAVRRSGGFDAAKELALTGEGRRRMIAIRNAISDIKDAENQLLAQRRVEVDDNADNTHLAIIVGHLLVFTLLSTSAGALYLERQRRDIAEQSLDVGQRRIREQAALLDKVRDAVLVCDMSGKIVYWNRAAETLYGWTNQEAIGADVDGLLFQTPPADMENARRELVERGVWTSQFEHVDKRRRTVVVEHRRTLIRDDDGVPQKQLIINIDVTERKLYESHALRRQRLESIGTLTGGIAHDLNNVLTPILMGAKLLASQRPGIDTQGLISTLQASAERGAEMVQQLLAFAGGSEVAYSPLRLSRVLDEVHTILRHTFPKSIEIDVAAAPDLWPVRGDSTGLAQVILNLAVNARDAMPEGGRLSIFASNCDSAAASQFVEQVGPGSPLVTLTVADTGSGIAPAVLDKIFDPFFTTKAFGKGTGLGLATSLGIVQSHGGFMSVRSQLGAGSTFVVGLPAIPEELLPTSPAEPLKPSFGQGEQILVIDDEPHILEMARMTLQAAGFAIATASGGEAGIEYLSEHVATVRAAVVDMMMPQMDGVATIARLRALAPDLHIVATSGLRLSGRSADAFAAGARVFLAKPYNVEQLLAALRPAPLCKDPHHA